MPAISVIVPVYKVEEYLPRCVDTILRQTFVDFELILVDDGSPDRCGDICEEYAKKDNRIIVLHQENKGLSGARNTGIEWAIANSNSQWLCFIDSDDWINDIYLESLYEAVKQKRCLIAACSFIASDKEVNNESIETQEIRVISSSDLYNEHFYIVQSACCKIFSKRLFEENEYRFEEGILYEDSALVYKIIFSQGYIAYTNKAIYWYFQRAGSITNEEWNPRRMIYFRVQSEQMKWLIRNGYDECVKTCLVHYLTAIHYNEYKIHTIKKYRKYAFEMRKISRRVLRKYRKAYQITIAKYPGFYETGYPWSMRMYWILKAMRNKLT